MTVGIGCVVWTSIHPATMRRPVRDRLNHREAEFLAVIEIRINLLTRELLKHAPPRIADPEKWGAVGMLNGVSALGYLKYAVLLPRGFCKSSLR